MKGLYSSPVSYLPRHVKIELWDLVRNDTVFVGRKIYNKSHYMHLPNRVRWFSLQGKENIDKIWRINSCWFSPRGTILCLFQKRKALYCINQGVNSRNYFLVKCLSCTSVSRCLLAQGTPSNLNKLNVYSLNVLSLSSWNTRNMHS